MKSEFAGLVAKWKAETEATKPAAVPVPANPADGAK
jgi:hypothetical protein